LDEIAGEFINALLASTENVPYGIRWICKQIRELVRKKFPDATREQVCGLIGGFYLLRFINPAIVTPQAFMLVENTLSANTRRNLTLLAKILQNLANNIKFGGVKEFYMEHLNVCIDKNKERLNKFLEDLTQVENLEQHLNLDHYLALERTNETMINISFNEMYFIHEMLLLHKAELCVGRDRLAELLDKLGSAPEQLARKDNGNIDLVLSDGFREEDLQFTGQVTPEQMYAETKFLLFTIFKSLPENTTNSRQCSTVQSTLEVAKQYAKEHNDKILQQKVKRIQKNCQELVKVKYLQEDDNYAQLRRDAVQELYNYEEQIQKSRVLMERLDSVLKTVINHQKFLESQYEAYKAYLEDVTSKCSTQNSNGKAKKKKDKDVQKTIGPFKYTYNQLEKDGIIKESEVPKERRSHIVFSFSSNQPGIFTVSVSWRSKKISSLGLELADLLERQQENRIDYETEHLKLDVNLLLHLLNKHFLVSHK